MRSSALTDSQPSGRSDSPALKLGVPVGLLLLAAVGWWWSAHMAEEMSTSGLDGAGMGGVSPGMSAAMALGAFAVAWAAMMAAMMLPAVLPVVKLYSRVAEKGRAAPVPFFVAGYLVLWSAVAVPGYIAWRALRMPLAEGEPWVGTLAGGTLVAAAVWQVTPLKSICLRHCRSPISFFLRFGGKIQGPAGALRMGFAHAVFCFGCCWALFAVLIALGTMNLLWMVLLTALIVLEKNAPLGERITYIGALLLGTLGIFLLVNPSTITHLT